MAKLTIKDEHGVERVQELGSDVMTIGRAPENSVHVTDQKFSRKHFQIVKDGEYYRVKDLGSTNGTRVNGEKVASKILRVGDVIRVGGTSFIYDGPCPPLPVSASVGALPEVRERPSASREAAKYVIVMVEGPDPGKKYELGHAPFTIGRHPSNVLQLSDEASSSYHAEIKKEPIGYICSDLGSTNGTRVKAKGQDGFERIVKVPLTHGMQVRIGKTVFELRNISGPMVDDQLLGTVPLDPVRLHDRIAERPSRPGVFPKVMVGVLAIGVFVGVIYLVLNLVPAPTDPKKNSEEPPVSTDNLVRHGDFCEGVNDDGVPKGWKPERVDPAVRVTVDTKEDATLQSGPAAPLGALVIQKSGAKNPACLTSVMTEDKFPVDSSKVYEFSGFMKSDGDGLFGLRIVWFRGDRELEQHAVVLVAPQPEWKERGHEVRPPAWADRAAVGVFAEGREGRACFDNLSFRLKQKAKVELLPTVHFREVSVTFETPSGIFSAAAEGQSLIESVELALATESGQPVGSIRSAIVPTMTLSNGKYSFRGRLFDFNLQQFTHYIISAAPGTWGVDLFLAVDRWEGQTAHPQLRFYIVGPPAKGDLEVVRAGAEDILPGTDKHELSDVGAVLFNAGGSPQLFLKFTVPVELLTRREGERRLVCINFPAEVGIEVARENVGARTAYDAKRKELADFLHRKSWAQVCKSADELEAAYSKRFKDAAEAAIHARGRVEEAFKPVGAAIEAQLGQLAVLKNFDAVKEQIQNQAPPWAGTTFEVKFADWMALVTKSQEDFQSAQGEEKAREMLNRALGIANHPEPQYPVVVSLCNAVIQRYPNSKAAGEARQLMEKAQEASKEQDRLDSIRQRLKDKARPYIIAGQWNEAVAIVEVDKAYRENRAKLKDISALIQEWKAKVRGE
jgi:pSer/pThr/pTyr-binding forkhead associated (FHA) protein